jgi:hypothetical protein
VKNYGFPLFHSSSGSFILSAKGDQTMNGLVKILHIDPDYQINYFIFRPRLSIRTSVPLPTAIELLKTVDFDLILSEPHDKAILIDYSKKGGVL